MSNSLFNQIGGQQVPQQMNLMQMVPQIRQNPASFLRNMGLNIPDGMNDPLQMAQYLVSSGQRPNALLQMLMSRMR